MQTQGRQFIGRDAMLARQPESTWTTQLLEIETGEVDPFYAHPVETEGRVVGIITSGVYGHRTGKMLALALLKEKAEADLSVRILGRARAATRLDTAPYDAGNARLKG